MILNVEWNEARKIQEVEFMKNHDFIQKKMFPTLWCAYAAHVHPWSKVHVMLQTLF